MTVAGQAPLSIHCEGEEGEERGKGKRRVQVGECRRGERVWREARLTLYYKRYEKTSDNSKCLCSTRSDWCSESPSPKIINLRSRLPIEIGLVPLTSFGSRPTSRSCTKSPTPLPKSEDFCQLQLFARPHPTSWITISLEKSGYSFPLGSSTARVAQSCSRQRSLSVSRRLITTRASLVYGSTVHPGPSYIGEV